VPDEPPTLEYRTARSDRTAFRSEHRRRSRNVLFLLVALTSIFGGVAIGLLTLCGALSKLIFDERGSASWLGIAASTMIALALLWAGYWAIDQIDSDGLSDR